MNLLVAILVGMCMGIFVEFVLPGHTLSEFALTGLLGIAGSLVTRFVGQREGWFGTEEPQCYLAEILGAVLLLIIYALVSRRRSRVHPGQSRSALKK